MVGRLAHREGRVAHSGVCLEFASLHLVLRPLLPEFCDFCGHRDVSPQHLFSCIPLCTTCGDKHISKNRDRG